MRSDGLALSVELGTRTGPCCPTQHKVPRTQPLTAALEDGPTGGSIPWSGLAPPSRCLCQKRPWCGQVPLPEAAMVWTLDIHSCAGSEPAATPPGPQPARTCPGTRHSQGWWAYRVEGGSPLPCKPRTEANAWEGLQPSAPGEGQRAVSTRPPCDKAVWRCLHLRL